MVLEPPMTFPLPITPARVLIVEDDRMNAAVLNRMLGNEGHETTWAPDGETALDLFACGHRGNGGDLSEANRTLADLDPAAETLNGLIAQLKP
jgi:CheY-like chemotaxis protein